MSGTVVDKPVGKGRPPRGAGDSPVDRQVPPGAASVLSALAALTGVAAALLVHPKERKLIVAGGPAAGTFVGGRSLSPALFNDPQHLLPASGSGARSPPEAPMEAPPQPLVVTLVRAITDADDRVAGLLVLMDDQPGSPGGDPVLDPVALGLVDVLQLQLAAVRRQALLDRALAESRREAAMARRESAAKTNFLAAMSHELRTPLNAIIGFSEIMKDQLFGPLGSGTYVEYAADVHDCGRHLLSLINDVLDMAKIAAHRMAIEVEWLNVEAALNHAVRMVMTMAHKRGIVISVSADPPALRILADDRALKQILFNLLSNAVKYSHPNGAVSVHGQHLPDGSVSITVEDRGVGMDQEQIDRLFRPFERADNRFDDTHQGIGLGLALVNNLVTLHGGAITIESTPGEGTRVTARFPCDAEAVALTTGARDPVGSTV